MGGDRIQYVVFLPQKLGCASKHLRWTMEGPHSSYSCFEIHICWKVEREARMEPPIQTEYFLSGGAMILILMVEGARAVISFCMRSAIPGYMVVPPAVPPVSSWTPVTVSPTASPSTRVTLSPTPSSVLTWLAVSSPTT